MKVATHKLTVAAVCTALAVIMCVLTAYLPLSFMPLYLAAFCIFLACKRSGIAYGVLCAVASVALMFLMTGLSVKWLMFILVFAPYGIVTNFIDKLVYTKIKPAALRVVIVIVFFNVTLGALYAIVLNVATVGLEGLNVLDYAGKVGGYAVLAIIATAVLLPLDFIFSSMSRVVLKRLPSPRSDKKPIVEDDKTDNKNNSEVSKYDIFGYKIEDEDDKK